MPAVPEVPITITGIHKWDSIDANLGQLMGWFRNSGPIMPPMDKPNCTLAKYINTSASRKFGVARPM